MTTATDVTSTTTKDGANVDSAWPGWTRWLPLTGIAFAVVAMAGNLSIGDFPDTDTSIGKLTTYYAAHHADVGRGGTLLGYAVVFFALFGIALWSRVRRSAATPVIGGALLLGVTLVAVDMITSSNSYYTLGQIGGTTTTSPQALQAWHITGSVGGVGADSIVFLLAIAAAGILARAFPRWLAWSALVLAAMHFTPLGFLAFLLFYVWAIAAGIALTIRPNPMTLTGGTL
jgi:hypothetical protein